MVKAWRCPAIIVRLLLSYRNRGNAVVEGIQANLPVVRPSITVTYPEAQALQAVQEPTDLHANVEKHHHHFVFQCLCQGNILPRLAVNDRWSLV